MTAYVFSGGKKNGDRNNVVALSKGWYFRSLGEEQKVQAR